MTRDKVLANELYSICKILHGLPNDHAWLDHWTNKKDELIDMLPSGSGVNGWNFPYTKGEYLIIDNAYDVMNENGFYTEVIAFHVIVRPTLNYSYFDVTIKGKFGKKQDIKDYLEELYFDSLSQEIRELKEGK